MLTARHMEGKHVSIDTFASCRVLSDDSFKQLKIYLDMLFLIFVSLANFFSVAIFYTLLG